LKSKSFWWIFVVAWCVAIFCFTESSFFTGENTEKILRHVMAYLPFAGAEGNQESSLWNLIIGSLLVFLCLAF
jgi:hypothetical protein